MLTTITKYTLRMLLVNLLGLCTFAVKTFDINKKTNLVGYWGQNSYGNDKKYDKRRTERNLDMYCEDPTYDILVISFLSDFGEEGNSNTTHKAAKLSIGEHCKTEKCDKVADAIKKCKDNGKLVLLSMGGYSGNYEIKGKEGAKKLADTIWDQFMDGHNPNTIRPFGDIKIDGIDLDIEKGNPDNYPIFLEELRNKYKDNNNLKNKYYITAAPQCPYPDKSLSKVMELSWVDMMFVQFYNNPCLFGTNEFNFDKWDYWATHQSKNKDVKIYLGLPASLSASTTGYISYPVFKSNLNNISNFNSLGGVMLWDVSQASENYVPEVRKPFAQAISDLLKLTFDQSTKSDGKSHKKKATINTNNTDRVNNKTITPLQNVTKDQNLISQPTKYQQKPSKGPLESMMERAAVSKAKKLTTELINQNETDQVLR